MEVQSRNASRFATALADSATLILCLRSRRLVKVSSGRRQRTRPCHSRRCRRPRGISPSTMLLPREYPDTSAFTGARPNTKRYAGGIEVNGGELESEWFPRNERWLRRVRYLISERCSLPTYRTISIE